ncbi:heterokaryon incompatibility protein-domain-containing protein [Apodospora peruviana]|uniref:Heterokaryon incompatibility protein-domain-containing protein n=1 Tax=Apodospora peruviana TaxID=516989 RepID=A0AAE0HV16_9PEZI|nr:heterokaryon incompatibility protein-domain-containing protein [Apodospora peruviana]
MAENMALNFQYTPFDHPSEQIRLLRIQAGSPDSSMQCSLTIVSLKPHPPPYVAISYTWGPPTPTTTISIDEQPMVVRQSCVETLRMMRLHHIDVPVWIDAICINQTDTREKSIQVGMMGSIYHSAAFVAACLQCGDSLSMMRNLYPLVTSTLKDGYEQNVFERWQTAVHAILGNAYFTRLWIVQEIGLARDLRLYSGEDVLDWSELETQAMDWRGKMMSLNRYPDGPDPERAFKELSDTQTQMGTHKTYAYQKRDKTLTLTGLMSSHLKRGCENPRDKIYAILPMLEHAGGFDSHNIQPDYDKSPWEVLWTYVRTIRFPKEPERRKNSISTGFELWTSLKTFEDLVECFRVSASETASFLQARSSVVCTHLPNYIETHFVGYALRICCTDGSAYRSLVRDNEDLRRLEPKPLFLAVWPGLPAAVFSIGPAVFNNLEALMIGGYYPCHGEVNALSKLPERCDCRRSSCPAKRSKREIYMHPEDLLAMVLLVRDSSGSVEMFAESFVRMWEPQQRDQKPPHRLEVSVSSSLASFVRSFRRCA